MFRAIFLVLITTFLWGISSALIAYYQLGVAGAALIAFLAGLVLLLKARVSGLNKLGRILRTNQQVFFIVALLEAINFAFYALALKHSSVPIATATHLMSPLFLMSFAIYQGKRRLALKEISIFALVISAMLLILLFSGDKMTIIGAGFGVLSALALASLIYNVQKASVQINATVGSGFQLLLAGLLLTPFILTSLPSMSSLVISSGIAVILFAPAFFIYWKAIPSLQADTVSILGFNEVAIATLFITMLTSTLPSAFTVVVAGLLLMSIFIEISSNLTKRNEQAGSDGLPEPA